MSILNRPLPPEELPTTRHAHLTDRVTQVLRDAMILPRQMESYDPAVSPETPVEDFNSHTYEDILATAILNKVLESCEGKRPDEVTIEVSHDVASTDTDSGMSGGAKESRRGRHKSEAGSEGSEERSLTPPARHTPAHRPPTASPDQGVVTDECWGPAYAAHDAPLQFKIEEHVEEVTTHHVTDEDEDDDGDASDSGSWRGSRGSLEDRKRTRRHKKVTQHSVTQDPLVSCLPVALPDPNQVTSRRVSFPELGRDIIQDSCSDTECCTVSPSDMVVEADSWEENWLFRRQRLAGVNNSDPITMLIPNPEAHITPTVGNRDVDELSELSEQRSVCSSEPWSDSDGEGEGLYSCSPNAASRELSLLAGEIVAEFGQQDQEYTVDYSAASRMAARRTPPPHSPSYSKPSRPHSLPQHTRYPMEASREHHNGRPVRGTSRDSESVSDTERPVPKPRKLSLATTPSSKASDKSPGKPLSSPMEDLTILSPPLDVPLPSEAKSSSETVWFVETPQDCIVLQGRTLRLSCVLNTKRPMGLTWYHNGSLVQSGGQEVWAWRRGPTHHLHLYNMTPAAAGVYAAAAYTASHCVWAFCRVHYKASARPAKQPTFTKGLTDAAVEECGELTLQCQVQGHPEPRVTFSRGTQQLQPSSRLAIESDQYGTWTLRLSDCALADAGQVTATASNTLASATCRCQVKVFPEGTSLPRQDASRSSRQHQSQSNQQLKGRSGSKPTQRTPHPGPHLSDNTARTPSTAALTTPSHLQLEDSLTTSSGAKSGGGEQEDILQVPTKPGTIAEREHRKWEAAVPLPNNPYSPERLAHRLSHTRPPDHAIYTRSSSVDFSGGSEVDLDPSLQDGIPCRSDLNRYSRDYYVAGGTNGTAAAQSRSNFVNHQKHGQEHSQTFKPQHLTNGCHTPPNTSQQVTRNGQEIRIALGGNQNSVTSKIQNLRDSQGKSEVEAGSLEVVGSCKAVDWKDELKDIQAARVEQEVARLQRTIDEKQRRWETYARHAPGRGISTLSDSSTEHLHHPRSEVYLLPPRHDLWRTVSEDTISVPLREATPQQPLLRHTSMDSLRPTTKVSNIQSLAHQPQQSTTSINSVGSSSIDGQPPNHSTLSHLGRSLESIGGYSDREAMDSDGSHHTPESPALPSVKKLASRFDTGPQKVNNLDKHGKNNSLSHSGKNIHSSGRVPQTDRATYTNNLNKRNEKPYVMKEVRSLAKPSPPPDPDTYSSDNWESDDAETVTSMSLPPTPVSLSNKYSFSTSSLIDTDSSHFDPKDTDTQAPGTFFGVTLRRTNRSSPVHVYSRKRDSTSSESSRADQKEMNLRRLSSTSEASVEQVQGPSSVGRQQTPSSSEEDAPATLRQSTIIKVDQNPRFSFSGHQNSVPFRKYAKSQSLVDLHQPENQSPPPSFSRQQHNSPSVRGYAFAPKGKRSMSNFLRAYTRQKSLHDIHQIDEKAEENFSIQGADDDYIQQRFLDQRKEPASLPTTLRKAKSEKTLTSIGNDSKNPLDLNTIASSKKSQSPKRMYEPTTVNGSTKKEIMHKNTSTTSAPKDSVQASVALVTTPSQEAKASVAVVTTPSQETKPSVAVVTTPSQETKASVAVATTPNQETKASVAVVTTPSQETKASVAIVTMPSQETNSVEEKIADMEKSVPKVTDHSSEGNKSPLESREDDEHVAATIVYCSGEDPSEIILNEAHVSAFQEHLKKEVQHFSEESSSSDGGQASSRGNTMRRHKSVEDLLKDYSNIKSLDRKKHSAPIVSPKKEPNAESTEPYKTVIAVEHNSTQAPSKIPHTSLTKTSSLTRPKPKPEPMPMKKSLSHSYFKNVNEETKNSQTVISVSGKKSSDDSSDGDVFHASTIYIGGGKSESNPDYSTKITVSGRASPPFKGEITVNDKHVIAPAEPQPLSSVGQHGSMVLKDAKKGERNKDTSDMPDSVITTVEVNDTFIKKERKGKEASDSSHVKVVNVTKKVNHIDYTAEDIEQEDPRILKELIMMESRTGKSGISAKIIARKEKMKDASVPLNSPFSPLRSQSRKKSSSSLSPSEEIPPKLTNQDSQDEGVDFPSDTAPSASSQDPAGPEGDQPRV